MPPSTSRGWTMELWPRPPPPKSLMLPRLIAAEAQAFGKDWVGTWPSRWANPRSREVKIADSPAKAETWENPRTAREAGEFPKTERVPRRANLPASPEAKRENIV